MKSQDSKTIVDQIVNSITGDIIDGKYKAGDRLPNEYELVESLQAGRNSVREAMKILSAMGIVEVRRGDGTYVRSQMSPTMFDTVIYSMIYGDSTAESLVELREILDEAALRMACAKATQAEIDAMYANVDAMETALKSGDLDQVKKLDLEFHMQLLETSRNPFFIRMVRGVYTIFEKAIAEKLEQDQSDSLAAYYHRNMLHCIETRDYANISRVVQESLKNIAG